MARTKVKGQEVTVEIGGTAIAKSTNCTLTLTTQTTDTSSKDDTEQYFNSPEITGMSWEITNESFVTDTDGLTQLAYYWSSRAEVTLCFNSGQGTLQGSAYITNMTITAAMGEYSTISLSFSGCGEIS